MRLDPRLLEILVCPACSGKVHESGDGTALLCDGCARSFPVRDGIPSMLVEDSTGPARTGSGG